MSCLAILGRTLIMSPNLSGIFSLYLEGVLNNITIGIKFLGGSKTFISNLWGGGPQHFCQIYW